MKPGLRVKLDLMKSRYTVVTDANKVVKQKPDIKFCYADINCQLNLSELMNMSTTNCFLV